MQYMQTYKYHGVHRVVRRFLTHCSHSAFVAAPMPSRRRDPCDSNGLVDLRGPPVDPSSISAHDGVGGLPCRCLHGNSGQQMGLWRGLARSVKLGPDATNHEWCKNATVVFDPRLDDGCVLRLFTARDIARCLRRRPARVLFFGDSLGRRMSSALMDGSLGVQPHLNARQGHSPNVTVRPWLAAPSAVNSSVSYAAAWRLDHDVFPDKGLAVFDRVLSQHVGTRIDLIVITMTLHVSPRIVQDLKRHLDAFVAVLRKHCATRVRGEWQWTTRLLWVLPHQPQDVQKSRQPYLGMNGAAVVGSFNRRMKTLLHEYAVPVYDAWQHTVDVSTNASVDGMHFPPWVFNSKAQAVVNFLCADDTACPKK